MTAPLHDKNLQYDKKASLCLWSKIMLQFSHQGPVHKTVITFVTGSAWKNELCGEGQKSIVLEIKKSHRDNIRLQTCLLLV